MIKLWLSNKMKFLTYALFFLSGFSFVFFPWWLTLLFVAVSLVCDFFSFKFALSQLE